MKKFKQIFIWIIVIINCYSSFSCKTDNPYFINKELKELTYSFYKDIDGTGFVNPDCSYIIVEIEKIDFYYKIVYSISNPSTFENLYTVIKSENKIVMIYSKSDISELVYTKEPYKPDIKDINLTDYSFIEEDVYYSVYYFNGKSFSKDTVF